MVVSSMSTVKVSVSDTDKSSSEDSDEQNDETMMTTIDSDVENDETSDKDSTQGENNALLTNEGWADSVAKILGSNKPKNKKTLVLSRAKKYSEEIKVKKEEKPAFEILGEVKTNEKSKDIKRTDLGPSSAAKKIKTEKHSIRVKPNILEKDRERLLSKIATKGVVQLFNAVRNQQKVLDRTEKSDLPESKKEKILKKFDKRTFLDSLMGPTKSIVVEEQTKSYKDELKVEEKPRWNALRDDFMMGAKMKDWDKEQQVPE